MRQHGVSKQRTWRKLHLGVDEATGEVLVAVVTGNDCHDGEVLADVLGSIADPIKQVSMDRVCDHRYCYNEIATKGSQSSHSTPQGCQDLAARQLQDLPALPQ
jgi:hypothetical protein